MHKREELDWFPGQRLTSLMFSPDGQILYSAGRSKTSLHDVLSGTKLYELEGDGSRTFALAVSADGNYLALGTLSTAEGGKKVAEVRIWDIAGSQQRDLPAELRYIRRPGAMRQSKTPRLVRRFSADQVKILCVAFSPDGKALALAGEDPAVRLFDVATGRAIRRFVGHEGDVCSLAFSPDGKTVASASGDRSIRLWEVATGAERRRFLGHQGRVNSIALSADGKILASGSSDTTALIWDISGLILRPVVRFAPRQLHALWADLGGLEVPKAYDAIWTLAAEPKQSLLFLRQRLEPCPRVDAKRIAQLIANLDSDQFSLREQATTELAKVVELAEPALKKVLGSNPSAELRRRVEMLLNKLDAKTCPERLRQLRAIEVLEHIGTSDAQRVLQSLAKGAPEARLTQEAMLSLERLQKKRPP